MEEVTYNEQTKLNYEHVPIYASSNSIIGTKYITKVYVISNGNRYEIGEFNGKLDELAVKESFAELMIVSQERQYGQQGPTQRKDLIPRRDRGRSVATPRPHQGRF